jgi:ABC-type uncharacterized transport system auxiliary subunit
LKGNRMKAAAVAMVVTLAVLTGCRSTPETRYYTLNMAPSGQAAPDFGLEVDRIRSAEPLARRNILVKKTSTEVEYYAVDQWAADPGELVNEKLSSEFGHRPDAQKRFLVSGEVLAFEQIDTASGPEAHIKLDLEFRREDADRFDAPALKKTYELSLPAPGGGPSAVAEALSRGLEQIAAQVIADAGKL